ncbi:MAG: hypothetical protein AB1733_19870, partial [Thermodesulfobacteriota bacterium]
LTLSPEAGERGFFQLPLPLGEGWGEGAFPHIDAQSCYDFWCVPSFETVSESLPYNGNDAVGPHANRPVRGIAKRGHGPAGCW